MTTLGSLPRAGTPSPWVFQQLGGDRQRLELTGTAGPMGRPRVGPIYEDSLKLRQEQVDYDGDVPPTRHLFGVTHEPIELHGRWSDAYNGRGFAAAKLLEVRRFVAHAQPVLITWADAVAKRGIIESLVTPREAEGEVEWRMTIAIDVDDLLGAVRPPPPPPTPKELLGNPLAALELDDLPKVPKTLRVGVFDFLSSAIAVLGELGNELNRVASQIRSFATAPLGLIRQFRAAVGQFKTTLIQLRNTFEVLPAEYAVAVENPQDRALFDGSKANFYASSIEMMRALDEADRAAELAEHGRTRALYTSRGGDTFESIATQFYGSADRAQELREANGAPAGSSPVVGTVYLIPE